MSYVITQPELDTFLQYILVHMPNYIPYEVFCYDLMYMTGCRAEESYRRDLWNKVNGTTYTLQPLKGNNLRTIPKAQLPNDFPAWYNNTPTTTQLTNYRKLQYHLDNIIGGYEIDTGNKGCLCHLFRHNYCKVLFAGGASRSQVKTKIGHTSIVNTNGYIDSVITSQIHI